MSTPKPNHEKLARAHYGKPKYIYVMVNGASRYAKSKMPIKQKYVLVDMIFLINFKKITKVQFRQIY
ncbi:hypothetical protein CDG79_10370 [Nostoc sp. 'Peltigera membranacea cyanobiont' 232]|nr:hypothetical protein CDG79_10370 [Nostoc sp. 'Peltigera membranacea cyanobiont' 232]